MSEQTEALGKVRLFSNLDQKALSRLEKMTRERTFSAGTDILKQGDEGAGVYVILSGKADVVRDGKTIASHGPGSFFGEMALLDNYRRSATVTAAEDTKCLVIPRADFLAEIHGNPDLCFQLLVQMSRRVRELEQALSNE